MAKCMYTQHSMQEKSNHTGATRHATKTLNNKTLQKIFGHIGKKWYFCKPKKDGEMAERSIAAVLKTVDLRGSGGSNPSLSAEGHK